MVVSVVLGALLTPIPGKLVDNVNPRILVPVAFVLRAIAVILFLFIQNP